METIPVDQVLLNFAHGRHRIHGTSEEPFVFFVPFVGPKHPHHEFPVPCPSVYSVDHPFKPRHLPTKFTNLTKAGRLGMETIFVDRDLQLFCPVE